jgi:hypothetical protein
MVIGVELVTARIGDIRMVAETSWAPLTQLPLQQAILIGSFLSLALFCGQIAKHPDLVRLVRSPQTGRWRLAAPPERLEPGETIVLRYTGVSFSAELTRINQSWPSIDGARGGILVIALETLPDVPSSTLMKALRQRATRLHTEGGTLILAGSTRPCAGCWTRPGPRRSLARTTSSRPTTTRSYRWNGRCSGPTPSARAPRKPPRPGRPGRQGGAAVRRGRRTAGIRRRLEPVPVGDRDLVERWELHRQRDLVAGQRDGRRALGKRLLII